MLNRILIYNSGGGIGDAIQLINLIRTLKSQFKNSKFYYLSAHENHFNSSLKDFNCEIDTLKLQIKYFGFRWWHGLIINKKIKENSIETFDLILDLQSKIRNSLILKLLPHKNFISPCLNFKLSKPRLNIKKEKKISNTIIKSLNEASAKVSFIEIKTDKGHDAFLLKEPEFHQTLKDFINGQVKKNKI